VFGLGGKCPEMEYRAGGRRKVDGTRRGGRAGGRARTYHRGRLLNINGGQARREEREP